MNKHGMKATGGRREEAPARSSHQKRFLLQRKAIIGSYGIVSTFLLLIFIWGESNIEISQLDKCN